MKSIENYIDAAIKKGYKFDAYTNVCHKYMDLNDYDNLGTNESHFGFTKDDKVWFWFTQSNFHKNKLKTTNHLFVFVIVTIQSMAQ